MRHAVLLIDDEPNVLDGLTRVLRKEPYEILTANSAEEAARLLENRRVDLIISDEEMPGMSGTEFLGRVAQEYPDTVRIVLTGNPTLPAALRAINEGKVYQFFTKPCNEIDLAITIRRALEQKDLLAKSRDLLEVTKRQSALIDEARLTRRLRGATHRERTEAIAKEGKPSDTHELLEEMEGAVRNGRELLREVRSGADLQLDPKSSATSAAQ
ncbi:MAG: response regulator [Planctomycetes bacterium]|nr:response regulator [Planctomycetota bacterium]